jgi:hypothetical protein
LLLQVLLLLLSPAGQRDAQTTPTSGLLWLLLLRRLWRLLFVIRVQDLNDFLHRVPAATHLRYSTPAGSTCGHVCKVITVSVVAIRQYLCGHPCWLVHLCRCAQ